MRTIYPKLITTLFLILFVAMLLKSADGDNHSSADSHSKTAQNNSSH